MELDRAAEDVVFAELTSVAEGGQTLSVLSEEVGRRSFGADYPLVLETLVDEPGKLLPAVCDQVRAVPRSG